MTRPPPFFVPNVIVSTLFHTACPRLAHSASFCLAIYIFLTGMLLPSKKRNARTHRPYRKAARDSQRAAGRVVAAGANPAPRALRDPQAHYCGSAARWCRSPESVEGPGAGRISHCSNGRGSARRSVPSLSYRNEHRAALARTHREFTEADAGHEEYPEQSLRNTAGTGAFETALCQLNLLSTKPATAHKSTCVH